MFLIQTTFGLEIHQVKGTTASRDTLSEGIHNTSFGDGIVDGLAKVTVGLTIKLRLKFLILLRLGFFDETYNILYNQTQLSFIFGIQP